jgi:hypothetical protein
VIETSGTEVVDALPVLAPEPVSRSLVPRAVTPAVQAAAVAAGGFVAGAAVVGLLGRRHDKSRVGRSPRRLRPGKRSVGELVQIVGTRSLLVDVHLLGSPGRDR